MSKKKKITKKEIETIYLKSDLSLEKASIKLNCSVQTLTRKMKEYGIKSKPKFRFGAKKGAKFSILADKEWLKEQLKTKSYKQIADEIGSTSGNIADRVKRHNLRITGLSQSEVSKVGLKKRYPKGRYGEDSSNWKGGISSLYHLIRTSYKNKEWRESCLKRDNYTCFFCGRVGGDLEVDHKEQLAFLIKKKEIKSMEEALNCNELWDTNNGRTLCKKCHKKTKTHSNKNF